METQSWDKTKIQTLLETNDRAVHRATVALYKRQTSAEQAEGQTREHNGRGYSAFDAEIMSSFAVQLIAGRTLSQKQMEIARKKLKKYAGQLLEVAKEKGRA